MPTVPLPNDPSSDQLRKQAKELRDRSRAADPDALALIAEHHSEGEHVVSLSGAQLVVARRYGFASWARLKRHLDVVEQYSRAPDAVEPSTDPVHEFLRLACLEYGTDDSPSAWADARALLAAQPHLAAASIHVAAADADVDAVRGLLARDPDAARRRGGPIEWEPLLYLAYARHAPDLAADAVLGTAQLLLEHGADPNAGYLWHGTYPFTAITGAFGGGELGLERQPPHPHAAALATVLLGAGADANDSQALYNRQFFADDEHLEVLFAHGLGEGDGGPWRAPR